MTPIPVQLVPAATLRQMFNDGTHSEIIYYFDAANRKIAVVHQYVLPDGTLGASGRPDPKELLVNGTLYRVSA